MDYYGRRLATCSSDKTIKIFEIANDSQTQIAELLGYAIVSRLLSFSREFFFEQNTREINECACANL
jgi:hypothetical protein